MPGFLGCSQDGFQKVHESIVMEQPTAPDATLVPPLARGRLTLLRKLRFEAEGMMLRMVEAG